MLELGWRIFLTIILLIALLGWFALCVSVAAGESVWGCGETDGHGSDPQAGSAGYGSANVPRESQCPRFLCDKQPDRHSAADVSAWLYCYSQPVTYIVTVDRGAMVGWGMPNAPPWILACWKIVLLYENFTQKRTALESRVNPGTRHLLTLST